MAWRRLERWRGSRSRSRAWARVAWWGFGDCSLLCSTLLRSTRIRLRPSSSRTYHLVLVRSIPAILPICAQLPNCMAAGSPVNKFDRQTRDYATGNCSCCPPFRTQRQLALTDSASYHGTIRSLLSGRGASYPAPPPQIPPCSFPAVGSRRRSNAIEGRSLAAHVPPTRRLAASVTRRSGSESGACVAACLSFDRPPSLHSLRRRFVVGFVRGFIGTTQPSDSSRLPQQLRLLDFLSWPGIAVATAGRLRSTRFRRDPFIRDVASDPGRATVPCVTAPHMLPSAVATASAPATSRISWLNPTPQMITVYASPWSSPSPTQHSLPGGRYLLPGPDFHRLDRASFAWRTATSF